MSGVLTQIGNVGQLGRSVATLLFGANNQPVSLGTFVFKSYEVPAQVTWGGQQMLTLHKLIGGVRVIDRMGFDPSPITWDGIMIGQDASDRAALLNQLMVDGEDQDLIFANRDYTVVVQNFKAQQFKLYHVHYTIECMVQEDKSTVPSGVPAPTFLDTLNADIIAATGIDVGAAVSTIQTSIGLIQPVLSAVGVVFPGSAVLSAISGGLAQTQGTISSISNIANSTLGAFPASAAQAGNLYGASTLASVGPSMDAAVNASGNLAGAGISAAYVDRAQSNVSAWSDPTATGTINRSLDVSP